MQDNPSETNFFGQKSLEDLAILADTAARRFIHREIARSKTFSENKPYERLLDADITVRLETTNDGGFNIDIQVSLTLPPFIDLNERVLAEEAANYALEEVEKKFSELKRAQFNRSRLMSENRGP